MRGLDGFSGVRATVTGPVTFTQHASRVFSARPRRSSVAFSSSVISDVQLMPSLIATGSAPQMPIRQPASIGSPLPSITSSSVWPGLGATRLLSGRKVTCGPTLRVAVSAAARPPAAGGAAGGLRFRVVQERRFGLERAQEPGGGERDRGGPERVCEGVDPDVRRVPVEDRERGGAEQARDLVGAGLEERGERGEDGEAHGDGERHLFHRDGEEPEHQAREGADEVLAVAAPVGVLVVQVGQVGGARVEVVAVLDAADARLAVRVGGEEERRLAVDPLDREQRADRAAPTALALQEQAAGERGRHRAEDQQRAQRAAVVEAELAQDHEPDEQAERDHVAVFLEPVRGGLGLGDAERARRLVGGRERAQVAPQARCRQEQQRQERDHDLPHHEQARVGLCDEQRRECQRADDAGGAEAVPDLDRDAARDLGVVGERDRRRAHPVHPGLVSPAACRRAERMRPRSSRMSRPSAGFRAASASKPS